MSKEIIPGIYKIPSIQISPKLQNAAIIVRNNELTYQRRRNKFSEIFKQCWKSVDQAKENQTTIGMFERYLVQKYGKIIGEVVPLYVQIDLDKKKQFGAPLFLREFWVLNETAKRIYIHRDNLEKITRILKFYIQQQNPHEEDLATSETIPWRTKERLDLTVIHSDGKRERFKTITVRRSLEELSAFTDMKSDVINHLMRQLKNELLQRGLVEVSTSLIREILAQQLKLKKFNIQSPEGFDSIQEIDFSPAMYLKILKVMEQINSTLEDSFSSVS